MINESVKINAKLAGLMGVAKDQMSLASQVAGVEEILARTAKLKAQRSATLSGSLSEGGGPEFEAKLKMIMDIIGEKQAELAEVTEWQNSNVNIGNIAGNPETEGEEADFISQITATIEGLSDQELANFFAELSGISSFYNTDSGKQKLAGMLAASEDRINYANAGISAALERISDMLGLDFDDDMFGTAFTVDFNAENIEHVVSIMWYLNQTIDLINEKLEGSAFAAKAGENSAAASALELIDGDDPAALSELSAALRKEKFNLEMAFRVIGVHEMISAMTAERNDKSAPAGIPQASDPANLGMSTSDTVKAFASLIKEELASANDRVHAITSGKAEMTAIEKAALKLGAIKSEILSSAIDGNSAEKRVAFEKAAAEFRAAVQKSAEPAVGANVKAESVNIANVNNAGNVKSDVVDAPVKTVTNSTALPISAAESTGKDANNAVNNTVKSAEDTNRTASASAAVAAKSASGESASLPVSASESANSEAVEVNNNIPRVAMLAAQGFNVVLNGEVKFVSFSDEFRAEQAKLGNFWAVQRQSGSAAVNNNATEAPAASAPKTPDEIVAQKSAAVNVDHNKIAANAAQVSAMVNADQNRAAAGAAHVSAKVSADQNKAAANAVQVNAAISAEQDNAAVNTARNNPAANSAAEQTVKSEPSSADKYAAGNAPAQAAAAASNNASAQPANALSANTSTNNMAAETAAAAEAGVETSVSSDSGDDPSSGFDTSNSRANAAEQADKARAAAMARVDQEAIIRQLTDKMQLAIRNGAHELRVTLRPEVLGEVRMSIRVQGDVVMARMQVESQQVKALVESNLQSLKDTLEKQNLHVGAFSVDVGSDNDGSQRKSWREMAEEAGISGSRGFKEGIGGSADGSDGNNDPLAAELGSDTGRRFGNNTFEYFI